MSVCSVKRKVHSVLKGFGSISVCVLQTTREEGGAWMVLSIRSWRPQNWFSEICLFLKVILQHHLPPTMHGHYGEKTQSTCASTCLHYFAAMRDSKWCFFSGIGFNPAHNHGCSILYFVLFLLLSWNWWKLCVLIHVQSLDNIRWWDSQEDISLKYDSFFNNVERVRCKVSVYGCLYVGAFFVVAWKYFLWWWWKYPIIKVLCL